jgi:DNA-binding protein Fis
MLDEALKASHGNQTEAARALGIGRDALRYKMKKFGLFH